MSYFTGSIAAVPHANRQTYIDHLRATWPMIRRHGATRMVEGWGVDVPRGKVNDLYGAVQARADEAVVFGWLEWPDKAAADAAWQKMQTDPNMAQLEMPFDGSRMIFGGFAPVFTGGSDRGAGYIQGFALAVPEKNRDAYIQMARAVWEGEFLPRGCLGMVETWGVDVPRGKQTDFYRASKAEEGEVPLFSWIAWPDKSTCDAASRAMEASMAGQAMPEMPFDGRRMMWGGFEPVFDSDRA
ncbi:MAG TPA: DUF1428 domain-containing protein [Paracoccaceae bacterium]|nr:DUF1428 domain-containing protein [Paracoccaceae bacterium]